MEQRHVFRAGKILTDTKPTIQCQYKSYDYKQYKNDLNSWMKLSAPLKLPKMPPLDETNKDYFHRVILGEKSTRRVISWQSRMGGEFVKFEESWQNLWDKLGHYFYLGEDIIVSEYWTLPITIKHSEDKDFFQKHIKEV